MCFLNDFSKINKEKSKIVISRVEVIFVYSDLSHGYFLSSFFVLPLAVVRKNKRKKKNKKESNAISIPRVIYLCDFIYNKNKNFFRLLCHKTIIIVQEEISAHNTHEFYMLFMFGYNIIFLSSVCIAIYHITFFNCS